MKGRSLAAPLTAAWVNVRPARFLTYQWGHMKKQSLAALAVLSVLPAAVLAGAAAGNYLIYRPDGDLDSALQNVTCHPNEN
jgi:hypothetical protein